MPDRFGFNHLPDRGQVSHICIECDWPGHGICVTEEDREKHARSHARQIAKEQKAERLANLAKARKARREAIQT